MLNTWDGDPWDYHEILAEISGVTILNIVYLDWKKTSNSDFTARQGAYSGGNIYYPGSTGEYGNSVFSNSQAYLVKHDITGTFGGNSCMTSYTDPDLQNLFSDTTSTHLLYAGSPVVATSDKGWEMNKISKTDDFWDNEDSFLVSPYSTT
jgi:hypothetical protein